METWKESQLKQLTFAKEIDTAFPILLRFANNIGFNFCAISVTSSNREVPFNALQINNYPREWNDLYEQNEYSKCDPVIAHCNHSMLPVLWSEELFSNTPQLWDDHRRQGLQHGWSQSFHDERTGLCSMLSLARKHSAISALELYEHFGYMFYVTSHLNELFASKLPQKSLCALKKPLTARELEVLKLSARGKTAYEIARILSLSERTVNFHVQSSTNKLGVNNKIAAVIAATRAGII